jgi:hypothetical protein
MLLAGGREFASRQPKDDPDIRVIHLTMLWKEKLFSGKVYFPVVSVEKHHPGFYAGFSKFILSLIYIICLCAEMQTAWYNKNTRIIVQ